MNNIISSIKEELQRHLVSVILPEGREKKSLYLIMVTGKTNKLTDFINTYGNQVTETHIKIAKKIFGENETDNIYGVFVDKDLQMIFAFNREFADYNKQKKRIVFKNIDDVLTDKIKVREKDNTIPPLHEKKKPVFPQGDSGSMILKYSLIEKKSKKP